MRFIIITCILCMLIVVSGSTPIRSFPKKVQTIRSQDISIQLKSGKTTHQNDIVGMVVKPIAHSHNIIMPMWKAKALLMVVASLYGLDYSICKILQRTFPPEVVSVLKYSLAAVYFLPALIKSQCKLRSVRVGAELGLWCTIYAISISHAVKTSPASKVSFFAALGMIFAPIYDILMPEEASPGQDISEKSSEKEGKSFLRSVLNSPFVAPLLAIIGVILMECENLSFSGILAKQSVSIESVVQHLRLLVSPLASSMCYWRAARMSREPPQTAQLQCTQQLHKLQQIQHLQQKEQLHHDDGAVAAVMLGTVCLLCGTVCVMKYGIPKGIVGAINADTFSHLMNTFQYSTELRPVFASLFHTINEIIQYTVHTHGTTILLILISSLLATGWSTLTEHRALAVLSAAQTSVLLSLEPLFATFFAYGLLGERVGKNSVGAAVFIIAASLWGPLAETLLSREGITM